MVLLIKLVSVTGSRSQCYVPSSEPFSIQLAVCMFAMTQAVSRLFAYSSSNRLLSVIGTDCVYGESSCTRILGEFQVARDVTDKYDLRLMRPLSAHEAVPVLPVRLQ